MSAAEESVTPVEGSSSPLAQSHEFILEQRARGLSYETITEMLAQRDVRSSPTAVGRYCRKHLADDEIAQRCLELKGSRIQEEVAPPGAHSQVVEMEALFAAAKLELETLLDARLNGVSVAAASIERSREQLTELKTAIHERPTVVAKLFEAEMQASAVKVLTRAKELEATLSALLGATRRTLRYAERRLLFAVWVIGVGSGALGFWLIRG